RPPDSAERWLDSRDVPGEEREDRADLANALIDVERAVSRLEHVHLVRVLASGELVDVAHRLLVRAAAVVPPDQEHHVCAHVLGEVHRLPAGRALRTLAGRVPAQQRAVVRLEERRELLVAALVVTDGDARDAAPPELGMLSELEERDVTTPGVACDDGSLGV